MRVGDHGRMSTNIFGGGLTLQHSSLGERPEEDEDTTAYLSPAAPMHAQQFSATAGAYGFRSNSMSNLRTIAR
jgi:hypothetical protein